MGDVFVFPEGFIHFQFNVGRSPAVAFAALSSQNPGVISIVNTVFGSNPPTNLNVLAKGFQLDPRVAMLMDLQAKILIMKYEIVFDAGNVSIQDLYITFKFGTILMWLIVYCKDPKLVTADDFYFSGLDKARTTESSSVGSNVTTVNVNQIPGLNTLGISLVRIDYRINGQNPPHTHPRATEILLVQEGTLFVGFFSSFPENRLFNKTLNKGDVFVFPEGLIHFQVNIGKQPAVAFASLSSQNPGVIIIGNTLFGSKPPIDPNVLAKAFQLDPKVIIQVQKKFG
ncbi:unnamed protein product [Arabidopsis thaliana]|uniref:Germin-like protein n=1 Tax=Arabidopsis thaliana TaxID=3702 RepID=A0A7G2FC41_ARATH|nr:unnamed protein product [Arabidopsis thaliana]